MTPQVITGTGAFNPALYNLPECPQSWTDSTTGSPAPSDGFALIKQITNVPEFHDCQKLITKGGTEYGPLVAIFAAYDLESLETRLARLERLDNTSSSPQLSGRTSLAAALILNVGAEYPALGIRTGYSCLYVWRTPANTNKWNAQMVWVNNDQQRCLDTIKPPTGTGNLKVVRDSAPGFSLGQYPAVARWDWDQSKGQQYIGIKCGKAWCEVGHPNFVRHNPYLPAPTVQTASAQVQRIKGWYDEQRLAEPAAGGVFKPSNLKGTVIPDTSLGMRTIEAYKSDTGRFLPVAYIALSQSSSYYKSKLNLDSTAPGAPLAALNKISFCLGLRAFCFPGAVPNPPPASCDLQNLDGTPKVSWWARIDPANGGAARYTCAIRMDHTAEVGMGKIPATARWRWLLNDETIWKECVTGCCQVRPLQ